MSVENFVPIGESRVLWSRFESLVGQQVFRLRVEGEAANIPTSLCSLLTCNLSSPEEGISHLEPASIQSGHLQRNSNALEIDKRPLFGLPYISQSVCPLLRLVLLSMQELRCLDRYLTPCDAHQRLKNIKRSLLDVHKKALVLESQLHQYVNPTLVTTLNRRTAKATFESELMCKLIDKLRKDSRQSATDPEKRKRACELTIRLKSLLLRQKCEWQCVGRLKETIAMARDMKGVLKFICQLSCLLEHCCDASRRLTERPPPYEYSSSYDSTSKQDSPDAVYEDLKRKTDKHSQPYQSQSSQSEITISLSLDFTSDQEFFEKSNESGSYTDTRTSNSRHQEYSNSRDTKGYASDSDAMTISSRQSRKAKEESLHLTSKSSRREKKRSKSASSLSSQKSNKLSRRHREERGKSVPSSSTYSTKNTDDQVHLNKKLNNGSRSSSPMKSSLIKKLSQQSTHTFLAEEALTGLIEVLEDYVESRSEIERRNNLKVPVCKSSPGGTSRQTDQAYSQRLIDSPKMSSTFARLSRQFEPFNQQANQFGAFSPKPSNLLYPESVNRQVIAACKRFETNKVESYLSSRGDFTTAYSMNGLNESRLFKEISNQSRLNQQRQNEGTISMKSLINSEFQEGSLKNTEIISNSTQTRLSTHYLQGTEDFGAARMNKQNLDEVNKSRKSSSEIRLSEHGSSKQDVKETRMSKQDIDEASINQRDLDKRNNIDHDELRISKGDLDETGISTKESDETRMSKGDLDETRMSRKDSNETKISKRDSKETKISKRDNDETKIKKQNLDDPRIRRRSLNESMLSQTTSNKTKPISQNSNEIRMGHQEHSNVGSQDLEQGRVSTNPFSVATDATGSTRMSQNAALVSEICKQYLHRNRISLEDQDKKINAALHQTQKHESNFCEQVYQQCLDKSKMDGMNLNQGRMSARDSDVGIVNTNYIEERNMIRNKADAIRSEFKNKLQKCDSTVQGQIASFSPYADSNRHTKVSKDKCKSTSPPRARREEDDPVYSSYEKSINSTLKSESSKSGLGKSDQYKNRLRKIKSYIVESNGNQQSSNTWLEHHASETDYDNKDDLSANRNISEYRINITHPLPKKIWIANKANRCSNRRASSLTSRKSDSTKYYMQPRCNSSESSGSREPLLFSSQETDLSFDNSSECSYRMSQLQKSQNSKKQSHRPKELCFTEDDSDLLENTTTTSDSCALDQAITSSHKSSSSSRQRPSSRTHSVDDTEGDIDHENDLEEELEPDTMLHSKSDLFMTSQEHENPPSRRAKSHQSERTTSDFHYSKHSSESRQSKYSKARPPSRPYSVNECIPEMDRRGSRHGKIHATTKNASPLRSSLYNPTDDRADGQDYRNQQGLQPDCCQCIRDLAACEGLLQAAKYCNIFTNVQSQRSQNLAKYTADYISSPPLSQNLQPYTASKHSSIYHSPCMQKDGSITKVESQLQSGFSSSTHPTRSAQRDGSAYTMQSIPTVLRDPSSTMKQFIQSPRILDQASVHTSSAPIQSSFSDPYLPLQQSNFSIRFSETNEQASEKPTSPVILSPHESMLRELSALQQPSVTTQSPGIIEQALTPTVVLTTVSPHESVRSEPSMLQQPPMSAHSSRVVEPESAMTFKREAKKLVNPNSIESVQRDSPFGTHQSLMSEHHPEVKEETAARTPSPNLTTSVYEDPLVDLKESQRSRKSLEELKQDSASPQAATRDPSATSNKPHYTNLSPDIQQKQSNATQPSAAYSQMLTPHSNTERQSMEEDNSPQKSSQTRSNTEPSYTSSKQSHRQTVSEVSRLSPLQSDPLENEEPSEIQSEYSRLSPAKSLQSAGTKKSSYPDDNGIISEAQSRISQSSSKTKPRGSSTTKYKVSVKPSEESYDGLEESELADTQDSGNSSESFQRSKDFSDLYQKWIWWSPLVLLLLLLFLYYLICYMTNTGGCVGCRAPLPNIFFSLMNSAVHSVRLIHTRPAPT